MKHGSVVKNKDAGTEWGLNMHHILTIWSVLDEAVRQTTRRQDEGAGCDTEGQAVCTSLGVLDLRFDVREARVVQRARHLIIVYLQ